MVYVMLKPPPDSGRTDVVPTFVTPGRAARRSSVRSINAVCASSVADRCLALASRCARTITSRENPCGVCARHNLSRSTVRTTVAFPSPSPTSLSVSTTGNAAVAELPARTAAMTRSMVSLPTSGRAAGRGAAPVPVGPEAGEQPPVAPQVPPVPGAEDQEEISLEELHRFPNGPVKTSGALHWNIDALFNELKTGLKKAAAKNLPIASISTDSWGVDYVLYDERGLVMSPVSKSY